jgi:hypothetical protein
VYCKLGYAAFSDALFVTLHLLLVLMLIYYCRCKFAVNRSIQLLPCFCHVSLFLGHTVFISSFIEFDLCFR